MEVKLALASFVKDEHSSLFGPFLSYRENVNNAQGGCIIKNLMFVIFAVSQ